MLGWSVPRRIGRPGVVTSTASAAQARLELASRAAPRRAPRARASMAARTVFATAPTFGRSSAGRPPIPRRTPVRRPFLPRTSSSSASSVAASGAAAIAPSASAGAPRGRGSGRRGPRRPRRSVGSGSEPSIVSDVEGSSGVRSDRRVSRPLAARRCARRSRCRGRRGRPGSCGRSRCRRASGR